MHEYVVGDFETRGTRDLAKCGVEVYVADPHFDVLCLAWVFGAFGKLEGWRRGQSQTALHALFAHVQAGGSFVAHNAHFELAVWGEMTRRHGWPVLRAEQCDDTMARANAAALPGSLEKLCAVLRVSAQKDMDGHRLMMRVSKPRTKEPLTWWEDEERLSRLAEYCGKDVLAQREVHKRLRPLSASERELWNLDYKINKRGVPIDTASVRLAAELAEAETKSLSLEMAKLTRGAVPSTQAVAKLAGWLRESEGVDVDKLTKANVAKLLENPATLTEGAKAALELRKTAAKASVSKLKAMILSVNDDARARMLLAILAATTGRWAGRRIQTQNLPRTPKSFKPEDAEFVILLLEALGAHAARPVIGFEYSSVLDAISWSLRQMIAAAEGREFVCADYANIEGRVAAWIVGEVWKIAAFRLYDTPKLDADGRRQFDKKGELIRVGPDLYNVAYSKSFGIAVELVNGDQRQIGKVQELALQYQGGHGAFVSMAAGYGIVPEELVAPVKAAASADLWERCAEEYEKPHFNQYGMDRDTWTALRVIIVGWRKAHPKIVGYWYALERAACDAIENPGAVFPAGEHIRFRFVDGDLLCRLPSGRPLTYNRARVETQRGLNGEPQRRVVHEGESSLSRKWEDQHPYGGLFFENIVQAVARDLLAHGLRNAEAAGFPVVMHVHDEILSEVSIGTKSVDDLCEAMCALPSWAAGLPVSAAGWKGKRYRK